MQKGYKIEPYFNYTPNERRGLIVIVFLLVIIFILRLLVPVFSNQTENATNTVRIVRIKLNLPDSYSSHYGKKYFHNEYSYNYSVEEKIDPNKASYAEFSMVGFPSYVINNIIKYRKSGGYFRDLADLQKIYGIDSLLMNRLKGTIFIDPAFVQDIEATKINQKVRKIVNINKVDSIQIREIEGIGKVLGKRIIKYRESLGGFIRKEQLKEVYGITPECYSTIESQVIIDSSLIKKLDINKESSYELSKHPYITDYQAKAIIKYRNYKSKINSINELLENNIFTSVEFSKILPYIK